MAIFDDLFDLDGDGKVSLFEEIAAMELIFTTPTETPKDEKKEDENDEDKDDEDEDYGEEEDDDYYDDDCDGDDSFE